VDLSNKNILYSYEKYKESVYILNNFTDVSPIGIFEPDAKELFKYIKSKDPHDLQVLDSDNDYFVNQLGFRGKIKNNPEIIAIGCSFTFGVGVPENGVWTNILEDKIGRDILNLGVPGYTVKKTCELAIKYMSKFNKPKTIFAFFPGFFRGMMIEDINFYTSSRNMSQNKQRKIEKQTSFYPEIDYDRSQNFLLFKKTNSSKFFKLKDKDVTYMENVLSPHQLISDAIDSISILQDFCYSHGIKLYWSTWDIPTSILMDTLLKIPNFKLKNYIKFADDNFNNYSAINGKFPNSFCNSDHESKLVSHPSWDCGSDKLVDAYSNVLESWPSHPGIHFQYHIANTFKNL
jgi:hypothetical protein